MGRTPLTATDAFERDGTFRRSLTFMTDQGLTEVRHYDDDSMVVICSPTEIYDWYGRRVAFDKDIDSVVRNYGAEMSGNINARMYQSFIVKKKNGKYAIALLKLEDAAAPVNTRIPLYKQILTGEYIGKKSVLECTDWEFGGLDEEILKAPVMQAFIKNRPSYVSQEKIDIFSGVRRAYSELNDSWTVIRTPENHGSGAWLFNCFVESREQILKTPYGSEPPYTHATYLIGNITISPTGYKMYAESPLKSSKGQTRIATDAAVLSYMKNAGIYWYYI